MAATDGQITLAASRFSDTTPVYLRDFSKLELPAIAKITKGQYHNLGVPTLSNPSLQSTALFLSAGKKYQILAQPIKLKDGRKPTNVGPKVLIPESYPGYFELLSEDGRSTRCIDSVLELARKPNLRVLVRETFRCNHLLKTIHAGEILTTLYDNGKYLKCRTQKDEVISLPIDVKAKFSPIAREDSISGVHTVRNLLKKRMPVVVRLVYGTAPKGLKQPFIPELRLLGCVEIDRVFALPLQKDTDLVAVPLNAKLKLQRAKNMDQLGHFIEYLRFLEKAQRLLGEARDRLQIVDVKLSDKEKKESKNGGSGRYNVPNFVCGLESGYVLRKSMSCDSQRYNIQPSELSPIHQDEYNDIDQIYDYVRGLAPLPKNLHRFETPHEPAITQHHPITIHKSPSTENARSQPDSGNYSLIRSSNNNNNNNNNNRSSNHNINHNNSINSSGKHSASHTQHHITNSPNGFNITHNNNNNNNGVSHNPHHNHHNDDRPVPPPIETIPGKKLPEKRQRPTLPKLFVKNSSTANVTPHPKLAISTQHSPAGLIINPKDGLEPQSPLFHIRYKSLSSLQLTPDSSSGQTAAVLLKAGGSGAALTPHESISYPLTKSASTQCAPREGTLDSSRSGGRTSGDSKLPEKKTRRLSRPRSLSNLVWELRPQKEKTKKKLYVHHYDNRQQSTLYLCK